MVFSEITSDEAIAPTRGRDWDDNGYGEHCTFIPGMRITGYLSGAFNIYCARSLQLQMCFNLALSAQQAAEARFLRAFSMYWVLDGYDQVPYREDLDRL